MSKLDVGSEVTYTNGAGKERTGIIHGVKKVDVKGGSKVIGYLVDTRKNARVDEIVTVEGEENILIRQPQQVEVAPDKIRLK